MNKPVNQGGTADAVLLSAVNRAAIFSQIDDPATSERTTAERVSRRYRGDHPEFSKAEERIKEDEVRRTYLNKVRDLIVEGMLGCDPMREKQVGAREGALALFDLILFVGMSGIGILGSTVALCTLATYVADSAMIPSLTDNYGRALVFSALPFSGSAVIKVLGGLQKNHQTERIFYRRIAIAGVGFIITEIVALTIFFAPQKLDASAFAAALANGVSPTNPAVAALKEITSYFVLGAGLLAEMFVAPAVIHYAHKLHRAGREIIVVRSDELVAHLDAIKFVESKLLDPVVERLGKSRAELDKFAAAIGEMTDATLYLKREGAADLKAVQRRATEEFFSKGKGGSR